MPKDRSSVYAVPARLASLPATQRLVSVESGGQVGPSVAAHHVFDLGVAAPGADSETGESGSAIVVDGSVTRVVNQELASLAVPRMNAGHAGMCR